jgi:peptidoglycan hydrolase-like protein with peptidoglycan-binding domain
MSFNFALLAAAVLTAGSSTTLLARQEQPQSQLAQVVPDTSLAHLQAAEPPWMTKAVARQWNIDRIKQAQIGLRDADLYGGRISGVFDAETRNAVREYQRLHDLPVTGTLSDSLLASLMAVQPRASGQAH